MPMNEEKQNSPVGNKQKSEKHHTLSSHTDNRSSIFTKFYMMIEVVPAVVTFFGSHK